MESKTTGAVDVIEELLEDILGQPRGAFRRPQAAKCEPTAFICLSRAKTDSQQADEDPFMELLALYGFGGTSTAH